MSTKTGMTAAGERGFSLVEAVVAMGILATALLSLAAVFAMGLTHVATSAPSLIAREKAREAVESVHTARDTRIITWAQINNVASGGVFLAGSQPMNGAGADGLVNTADDATAGVEKLRAPGPDNRINTADDVLTPLSAYTRQIEISPLLDGNGVPNATVRQLRVTIGYRVGRNNYQYVLVTYVSAIS